MNYKIIDFHTHPFFDDQYNLCNHTEYCNMSAENTKRDLQKLGVQKICGSVIKREMRLTNKTFDDRRNLNDYALKLKEFYGDFYYPGFHVHPDFVKESIEEIERMNKLGLKLIGELVPYLDCWQDFTDKGFYEILEVAEHYDMVVNVHSHAHPEGLDQMDKMVKDHKNLKIVAAHPGETDLFQRHLKRMEMSENYFLDLSGTGIFRHGLVRHGIDEFGAERFLYGSDYPICNPANFVGGVALDFLLSEEEKQKILYDNAKKLLNL